MSDVYLWETYDKLGRDALETGDLEQANEAFRSAVATAEEIQAHDRMVLSLRNLAATMQDMNQMADSHELLQRTLEVARQHLGNEHSQTVETLRDLSQLCQQLGYLDKAEEHLKHVLEQDIKSQDTERIVSTLLGLARLSQSRNEPAVAAAYLQRVVKLNRQKHGDNHPEVAQSLLWLATALYQCGKTTEAQSFMRTALGLMERHFGDEPMHLAQSLLAGAKLMVDAGQFEAALNHQKRALDLLNSILEPEHEKLWETREYIATTLAAMGKIEESIEILEFCFRHGDPQGARAGATYKNLAGLYLTLDKKETAEELYQKATEILEATLGSQHPAYLATLEERIQLYHFTGRSKDALSLALKTIKATENRFGAGHPNTAQLYASTALLAHNAEEWETALELMRAAEKIWSSLDPRPEEVLANCHANMATCLIKLGRPAEAEPSLVIAENWGNDALKPVLADLRAQMAGSGKPPEVEPAPPTLEPVRAVEVEESEEETDSEELFSEDQLEEEPLSEPAEPEPISDSAAPEEEPDAVAEVEREESEPEEVLAETSTAEPEAAEEQVEDEFDLFSDGDVEDSEELFSDEQLDQEDEPEEPVAESKEPEPVAEEVMEAVEVSEEDSEPDEPRREGEPDDPEHAAEQEAVAVEVSEEKPEPEEAAAQASVDEPEPEEEDVSDEFELFGDGDADEEPSDDLFSNDQLEEEEPVAGDETEFVSESIEAKAEPEPEEVVAEAEVSAEEAEPDEPDEAEVADELDLFGDRDGEQEEEDSDELFSDDQLDEEQPEPEPEFIYDPDSPDFVDRRSSPRSPLSFNRFFEIHVASESGAEHDFKSFLVDLGPGGIRINSESPFPLEYDLQLTLPEDVLGETISLDCQVVWQKELYGASYIQGLAFKDLNEDQQKLIDAKVAPENGSPRAVSRQHFRLYRPFPIKIKAQGNEEWVSSYATDLSVNGIGTRLKAPIDQGNPVRIRLELEFELPPVEVEARVAWSKSGENGVSHGLQFATVGPVEAKTIKRYIDRCLEFLPD